MVPRSAGDPILVWLASATKRLKSLLNRSRRGHRCRLGHRMEPVGTPILRKDKRGAKGEPARREVWRRLDDYFEVLRAHIRSDRERFHREMARDPDLRELYFVK